MDETGVPGENHRPVASHWQTLSHNVVSSTPCLRGIQTQNVSGGDIDCTVSCKSKYHDHDHDHDGPQQTTECIYRVKWKSAVNTMLKS